MNILAFVKNNWSAVLLGALALVLILGLYKIDSLRADNALLALRLADSEHRAAAFADSLAKSYEAVAAREAENRVLAVQYQKDLGALQAAFAADPESCEWSRDKIPGSVLEAIGCGG